jgi:hypothetical protein
MTEEENNAFAPLAKTDTDTGDDVSREIERKTSGSFIPQLRIAQSSMEQVQTGKAQIGEILLSTGENLGHQAKVVIGPWRNHAIRFENMTEVGLEDFNLTPNSIFVAPENKWVHPDGMTPGYREILEKRIPDNNDTDNGPLISNCAGHDVLFWLPDQGVFALFLVARTALSMANIYPLSRTNRGASALLSAVMKSSKKGFKWQVPMLSLSEEQFDAPSEEASKEIMEQFLSPGIMHDPKSGETKTRPR